MNALKRTCLSGMLAGALAATLCGCAYLESAAPRQSANSSHPVIRAIQGIKDQYAPVSRLAIFNVGAQRRGVNLS